MSFLEHLEELRRRLIIILIFLTIATIISFFFSWQIFSFLLLPIGNIKLVYLSPIEPFMVKLKIALFSGIVFSSPVILHQALGFFLPGIKEEEKKILWPVLISFIVLFVLGCLFSFFFVLPYGLKWLFSQASDLLTSNIRAEYYIAFIGWFVLVFGLVFETPLIIISLIKLKICTYEGLRQKWQIVYLSILIISAILTPDWNPITMLFMAAPLILLYEISLAIGKFFLRFTHSN